MSITFNGVDQLATLAAVPDPASFVLAAWCRRDSDSGAREHWASIDDGTFFQQYSLAVSAGSDQLEGYHGFNDTGAAGAIAAGAWSWVMYRYAAGTMQVRRVLDTETTWGSNQTVPALSTLAPTDLTIAARYGGGTPSEFAPVTCALLKIWSGPALPTDEEVLAARLTTAASGDEWARYDWQADALDTDRSGNSRTVTLTGAPTFTAEKPTDLVVSGDVFGEATFDDVLFDTGVAIANVPPFSDVLFDTVPFDTGAVASTPLYIGADGESVIRLGTRSASALYLGPRTLF